MVGAMKGGLLAATLLAAAPAVAAQPDGGHYVWVPAGATVLVLPDAATPADFPVARMIARQEAMMHRMFADMDSLLAMPMPDPAQIIRSVTQGMPRALPGSGIVVTSISTGSGTCSQTITYGYPRNGGAPQVKVSSTGNACGMLKTPGPIEVQQTAPPPPAIAPRAVPQQRLWTVGYPPHPVTPSVQPRM